MSVLPLYYHNSPVLVFINVLEQFFYGVVSFLDVHIRHAGFIKVLYFVVWLSHMLYDTLVPTQDKRVKHKSNASSFQDEKGGAVPTNTHQMITERLE